MRAEQLVWSDKGGWRGGLGAGDGADLVLYFGMRQALANGSRFAELKGMFPRAHILGCSTGGQIHNDDVTDEEIKALALGFDATRLRAACEPIEGPEGSRACGQAIGRALAADDLAGVFVLSDGLAVNGSALVAGIGSVIGKSVPVTGGLAGDGPDFKQTLVGGDCPPSSGKVAAVGFYGPAIQFGHGSAGGWDMFGPQRRITRSAGSLLLELDGKPALDLHERYLDAEDFAGLPGTALLYPLRIFHPDKPEHDVVRTVLAVDRAARSMTFAGDMPEGWMAQLMRGRSDRLVAGAAKAARRARAGAEKRGANGDGVAILVSCIGRRLLMGQRIVEEVEAVSTEFGPHVPRLGFYSYGEISPHYASGDCELHNQTMTITLLNEMRN
jgi:hypothetical protein